MSCNSGTGNRNASDAGTDGEEHDSVPVVSVPDVALDATESLRLFCGLFAIKYDEGRRRRYASG